jgi:branched-chain amino acid transport system ATP-binding protein
MTAVLRAEGLRKRYGGHLAVDGVSLQVAAGEMLAMIGPNGAGKSTCFSMIGGQVAPDSGHVWLDGSEITGLSPEVLARRGVGRSFQIGLAFGSMTVRENVQAALSARAGSYWGLWRAAREIDVAAADTLLADVSLTARADDGAGVLAHGDVKRLELALALACAPSVLLMDEPTAGMAAAERAGLMRLVRRLATERKLAVLFTEHDMDAVFDNADRVLVLHQGSVIASGPPEAVRTNPQVRAAYLGQ